MSTVLIDTHVLVWLLEGNSRLGPKAQALINAASKRGEVFYSAITPWEIAMLVAKSRLAFDRDVLQWLQAAEATPGLGVIPITTHIAVESTRLPETFHADPADRLIVASARDVSATLVTADAAMLTYAGRGHVRAIAASD